MHKVLSITFLVFNRHRINKLIFLTAFQLLFNVIWIYGAISVSVKQFLTNTNYFCKSRFSVDNFLKPNIFFFFDKQNNEYIYKYLNVNIEFFFYQNVSINFSINLDLCFCRSFGGLCQLDSVCASYLLAL